MSKRENAAETDSPSFGELYGDYSEASACGACGRILRGTAAGERHYCPHTQRTRRSRELTEEELEEVSQEEHFVADPAGRGA